MPETLVRESAVEFFRDQLVKAMQRQRVAASALTEGYLVQLLAGCLRGIPLPPPEPGYEETPLAVMYLQALNAARAERVRLLRGLGDAALFVAGFFPDSLDGKPADAGYYRALGGFAYGRLSQEDGPLGLGAGVFGELAARFSDFADVLGEVSEASRLSSSQAVLRLYERWRSTGSRRAARLLAERGLCPLPGAEGRPQ